MQGCLIPYSVGCINMAIGLFPLIAAAIAVIAVVCVRIVIVIVSSIAVIVLVNVICLSLLHAAVRTQCMLKKYNSMTMMTTIRLATMVTGILQHWTHTHTLCLHISIYMYIYIYTYPSIYIYIYLQYTYIYMC